MALAPTSPTPGKGGDLVRGDIVEKRGRSMKKLRLRQRKVKRKERKTKRKERKVWQWRNKEENQINKQNSIGAIIHPFPSLHFFALCFFQSCKET